MTSRLVLLLAALGAVAGCSGRSPSVELACWATQRWIDATPAERAELWDTVVEPTVERLPTHHPIAQRIREAAAAGPDGLGPLVGELQRYCD
ncbi:hypothetical protein ACQEVB_16125 [Pseudonocardia sp. CA-107938]|uniref:hypothetical protein n=1 Tax=Pseudonocardia sp. CA-107938 TaxID=3240021 RepID=UPI003D927FC8